MKNTSSKNQSTLHEQERDLLLSFSGDFVSIRDTNDLLNVVTSRLRNLIGFNHIHISTINNDGKTFTSFIADPLSKGEGHPLYPELKKMKLPIENGFTNKSYNSAEPVLINLESAKDDPEIPFYFKIVYETGIKQMVIMRLLKADNVFGFWFLFFTHAHPIDINSLQLIKGISHQISSAVSNIISNEEIKKREEEKTRILAFSNAIVSAKDKKTLSKIIQVQLASLFNIKDFCFFLVSKDKTKRKAFLFDEDALFATHPSFINAGYMDNSDKVYDLITASNDLMVFDVTDWEKWPEPHPFMDVITAMGMKQMGGNMVRIGEEDIGIMTFSHDNIIEVKQQLGLYESICSQLAVVASNLYNTEKIIKKEEETARILEFSNAIASASEKIKVCKIIKEQLADLFKIKDFCFFLLSPDRKKRFPFLYDLDSAFANHPAFINRINTGFDNTDGMFESIVKGRGLVVLDVNEWKKHAAFNQFKEVIDATMDMKQMGGNLVYLGEEPIGIMGFIHDDVTELRNRFGLYESICSQLAFVASNLYNHEQISRKEEETARILEFSNAIASVRDKELLGRILQEQLSDIFGIANYCIWLNSKDKEKRIPFLFNNSSAAAKNPLFQKALHRLNSTDDYLFTRCLATDDLILLDSSAWDDPAKPAFSYAEYANEFHFKGLGASRIRLADEDIAVIVFGHNDIFEMKNMLDLYRSICAQLSVAISNLLATEKISEQLVEINRYKQQLEEEKIYLQEEIAIVHNSTDIIGNSPAINTVFELINKVSASNSTVLILGETGTGKELVARAIHNNSGRKSKLMVKVNCAALPAHLIESELFGHERGSFTGAYDRRIGKFELANNGTLFLDEIGEMPLDLQVKLLRVLQEKEIERIGGKTLIKIDTRIIAATNRDLEKEVKEGRFREDLYYRLNIFPIQLPTLKERAADIPLLVSYFIEKFSKQTGKKIKGVSNAVMKELNNYAWQGNIRELEHFIERSILLTNSDTITNASLQTAGKTPIKIVAPAYKLRTIEEHERELILETLSYCNGQISGLSGASHILGIPSTTLHSKMKKLGIVKSHSSLNN